ncbi:hypothetical protein [Kitasatospora griseola]|uniref:hypothetical protein n=1 Tax=Kitasatospora griseola TaxID=2064 RepID=UPI003412B510
MNPHNPRVSPGAHLVHEQFGTNDFHALHAGRPEEIPMALLGQEVSVAAREVDRLHLELSARAQLVIERLAPIARGDHAAMRDRKAVIPPAGHTVEVLAARYGTAYQQLTRALSAYAWCVEAGLGNFEAGHTAEHRRAGTALRRSTVTDPRTDTATPPALVAPVSSSPRTR